MSKTTIIGCGDIGTRLAKVLLSHAQSPNAWVRTAASQERLNAFGIMAQTVDLDLELLETPDLTGHHVYYLAPPGPKGELDLRVRNLINLFYSSGSPDRVVYLSTTGVYGDCAGEWVDETRPPAPRVDRAKRRLDAETNWRQWADQHDKELVILRVAGIYGPGKLPLQRLKDGTPMVRPEDAPITNHIHSDDLVQVCLTAMKSAQNGEVYNVADDHPNNMTDYFIQVADRFNLPRPPLISAAEAKQQLSPGMLSYLAESRRLNNEKMINQLGIQLGYPDLQSGLAAC